MPLYDPNIGLISNIQKYSTKDGPGIRDTVFFKGCPLGCLWCSNPELIRSIPDLLYSRNKCIQCGSCIRECHQQALVFNHDREVQIDRDRCDACGDCVDVCPEGALELIGYLISVDELVGELLKDKIFYQTSHGGVTFSGGEPLWQAGFIAQVASRLKKNNIQLALDTAGDVAWCRFEEVLEYIDLVLYDIKTFDRNQHIHWTGRDNDLILANARLLAEHKIPIHVRLVLIPGFNDTWTELNDRMQVVLQLGNVQQVDLIPYHRYGQGKYDRLGLDYPLEGLREYNDERIAEIEGFIKEFGIKTSVGG